MKRYTYLTRRRTMKRYTYLFHVRQRELALPFPIDMLRYDACIPAGEIEADKIAATHNRGSEPRPEYVELRRYAESNRYWTPTAGRWESFGWEVVPGTLRCSPWEG